MKKSLRSRRLCGEVLSIHRSHRSFIFWTPAKTLCGGVVHAADAPSGLPLTEEEARHLAEVVSRVAEMWGGPVNLEFIWRAGRELQWLQVRSAA